MGDTHYSGAPYHANTNNCVVDNNCRADNQATASSTNHNNSHANNPSTFNHCCKGRSNNESEGDHQKYTTLKQTIHKAKV
jgi:hypothetical protein